MEIFSVEFGLRIFYVQFNFVFDINNEEIGTS